MECTATSTDASHKVYEGCWYLTKQQFGLWGPWTENLTIDSCMTYCSGQGFPLFALKAGVECSCGYEFLGSEAKALEKTCRTPCAGDPETLCGGQEAYSIWRCTRPVESHSEVQRVNARLRLSSCEADLRQRIFDTVSKNLKEEFGTGKFEVLSPEWCKVSGLNFVMPLSISVHYVENNTDTEIMTKIQAHFDEPTSDLVQSLINVDPNFLVISASQTSYMSTEKSTWDAKMVLLVTGLLVSVLALIGYFVFRVYSPDFLRKVRSQPAPYFATINSETVPLKSVLMGDI
eukprot:TRINITY_DN5966_c0_g1_i1.p1 TRINITY_DN5966_c0_g1~~TRINITY_DN5966_c0_g1_i1.p1  ORF type:complete len:305 (-),score=49.20 TRINITY_DN5966_c0_g1_i1:144-1010(-)